MDAFKEQLQRIQEQLSGLSGTQRMLVFALVTVMVLTLLLWSRYASAPDQIPLFSQGVADQDMARVQGALQVRNIPFTATGATIMVQPDDRMRALAAVTSDNALPSQSSRILDDIMSKMKPFDTAANNNELWKQHRIEMMRSLIALMDNVREVQVNLDLTSRQRFGGSITPRVGVNIKTQTPSQQPGAAWIEGVGKLVAGSVAGLKREDIHLVVDSRPYELHGAFGAGAGPTAGLGSVLELQTHWEKKFVQDVTRALGDIPGLYVSVSARLNTETKETRSQEVQGVITKEREVTQETTETVQSGGGTLNDPAVGANTGGSLSIGSAAAGGGGNSSTTEKSVTKNEMFPTVVDEVTKKPPGDAVPVAASVTVPRSWYVQQLKRGDPSAKEPDPAAVEAKIAVENGLIQEQVKAILHLADASAVTVRTYVDAGTTAPGGFDASTAGLADASAGSGGVLSAALGRHAKEIAVGLLAGVSLLLVMMIVRKGNPPALALPEPARATIPSIVEVVGSEPLAGIAAPGSQALDAMELGEDDLRGQQVVDQVNSMVKENPDAAAALVKRWLNRA